MFEFLSNEVIYAICAGTVMVAIFLTICCASAFRGRNRNAQEDSSDENVPDIPIDEEDIEMSVGVRDTLKRLKAARLRKLSEHLTKKQQELEERIEREQLAAIHEVLKRDAPTHKHKILTEEELRAQLNLYR